MNKEFIKEQLKMREQLKVTPTRESGISEVVSGELLKEGGVYLRRDGLITVLKHESIGDAYFDIRNDGYYFRSNGSVVPDEADDGDLVEVLYIPEFETESNVVESSGGTKYDSGKPRMDLLVPEADEVTAKVFTFGAGKYGDLNWMKGINYSRLHAALRRHVSAWARGVDLDDESGLPHLAHARCCLDMLLYFQEAGRIELDDRPSTQSKGESK
jgi:hypothetical protein